MIALLRCAGSGSQETGTDAGMDAGTDAGTVDCVLDPSLTKGPYWVDEHLNRSDIRADRVGLPLALQFTVYDLSSGACAAFEGAQVDIWHCDAGGTYSDVAGVSAGQTFLRGYQVTGADGVVKFTTIYPGWYSGRAVHIHVKVRMFDASNNVTTEATTQVFFDDPITDGVYANVAPYNSRSSRDTRNPADNIYSGQTVLLLNLTGNTSTGYSGSIALGVKKGTSSAVKRNSSRRGLRPAPARWPRSRWRASRSAR